MNAPQRAALYHHLRYNHYPPAANVTICVIAAMLDGIEDGSLSPHDPVKVTLGDESVVLQKGDRAATVAETIADFHLGTFIRENML